jgi:geranylgeranyl diphosphate synthase type I
LSNPLDAYRLRARVQAVVDAEIATQEAVLAEIGADMTPFVDLVASLVRGGKRLRAAFFYWGYRAGGGPDSDAAIRAAASMEFFQAAALLHDDVMDGSDTRRGMPSAHRRLAAHHAAQGWSGNAARYGEAGAILAGDLCLTWTDEMYATSGLPAHETARGRELFDRMRTQLMGGQFLDVLESVRGWDGLSARERVERARHVIRYKSAKYTVEHPLLIGATAAGAQEGDLAALSRYGLALGEAFQLRDDVLGVFGDPEATGKPAGDDLREGKRTVLVAQSLASAEPDEIALFDKLLGVADLDDEQVAQLRAVISSTGALDRVEQMITEQAQAAHDHLHSAQGLTAEGVATLESLIGLSTARSA